MIAASKELFEAAPSAPAEIGSTRAAQPRVQGSSSSMTVTEAAALLDVGERWVRDLIAQGLLDARQSRPGGSWLIDRASVERRAELMGRTT